MLEHQATATWRAAQHCRGGCGTTSGWCMRVCTILWSTLSARMMGLFSRLVLETTTARVTVRARCVWGIGLCQHCSALSGVWAMAIDFCISMKGPLIGALGSWPRWTGYRPVRVSRSWPRRTGYRSVRASRSWPGRTGDWPVRVSRSWPRRTKNWPVRLLGVSGVTASATTSSGSIECPLPGGSLLHCSSRYRSVYRRSLYSYLITP